MLLFIISETLVKPNCIATHVSTLELGSVRGFRSQRASELDLVTKDLISFAWFILGDHAEATIQV
ncbi:MAG: hypothetical protein ACJAVT_001762 [Yoonia sp.]